MNPDGRLIIHDVRTASAGTLTGVRQYSFLHSVGGKSITNVNELCRHLLDAEATGTRVEFVTRVVGWAYRSRTVYRSHKIEASDVRLVGLHAPAKCK